MWNDKKSLFLSKCCIVLFMLLLFSAVFFVTRYISVVSLIFPSLQNSEIFFILTIYAGGIAAAILLVILFALLHRISAGEVFVRKNTACLRKISWCCIAGAVIASASAFYWVPWLAVAVAAAFMGLIVRVIKNVFAKAIELQDDAEFTI